MTTSLMTGIVSSLIAQVYWLADHLNRADPTAHNIHAQSSSKDQGTTLFLIKYIMPTHFLLPWLLRFLLPAVPPMALSPFAVVVLVLFMLLALAGRIWCLRTLGKYFTRTLCTREGQTVVRSGPYAYVCNAKDWP